MKAMKEVSKANLAVIDEFDINIVKIVTVYKVDNQYRVIDEFDRDITRIVKVVEL